LSIAAAGLQYLSLEIQDAIDLRKTQASRIEEQGSIEEKLITLLNG